MNKLKSTYTNIPDTFLAYTKRQGLSEDSQEKVLSRYSNFLKQLPPKKISSKHQQGLLIILGFNSWEDIQRRILEISAESSEFDDGYKTIEFVVSDDGMIQVIFNFKIDYRIVDRKILNCSNDGGVEKEYFDRVVRGNELIDIKAITTTGAHQLIQMTAGVSPDLFMQNDQLCGVWGK